RTGEREDRRHLSHGPFARLSPRAADELTLAWRSLTARTLDAPAAGAAKTASSVATHPDVVGSDVPDAPEPSGKPAILVLPFTNISGDSDQDYFSDGITEDIITDLSQISALSVISRNTAFTFKSRAVDIRDVARRLEAGYVLEGSVRKADGRIRVTAQLIDA